MASRSAARVSRIRAGTSPGALRARRKFLRFFPEGFQDETFLDWERNYKVAAHERFCQELALEPFTALLGDGRPEEAAAHAVRVEARTHLLFSFEKMALRDAVRSPKGASAFSEGLYEYLYGPGALAERFDRWCDVLESLPRAGRRVLTWPVATVFGFLALPEEHFFFKPNVTRRAALAYGVELPYHSRPQSEVYESLLSFAETVRRDLRDLGPRDMIDIQSFLWVQGSEEYD